MDNSLYLSSALYDIATIKDYAIEGKMNAIESYVQLKTIEKVIKERTKATMEEKRENKALAISYLNALGYNDAQIQCATILWTRESRFDHLDDPLRVLKLCRGWHQARLPVRLPHSIQVPGVDALRRAVDVRRTR